MRRAALLASIGVLLAASPVAAQQAAEIDVERFKPFVTYDGFLNLESSAMRPTADRWAVGVFLNYQRNPLVAVDGAGGLTQTFVNGRLGADVMASVTIAKPFSLGIDIPFFLAQTGDSNALSFAGLGDIRLVPKVRFVGGLHGFGLGLSGELRLPTHVGDFSGGARNVVFAPRAILDYRHTSGFRIGTNLGVNVREGTTFYNVDASSEFAYGLAIAHRIGGHGGKVEIGGEAVGAVGLTAQQIEELPLEGSLYGKINPTDEWEIQLGPGIGIVPGYGIPVARAFLGVRFTPTHHDKDHDGIPDDKDKCPNEPENHNGIHDGDGCPEEDGDSDGDGVPDSQDLCPREKETINGIQDEDGCPDGGPAKVIREEGDIKILENIRFKTSSAQIDPASYSILDQVALVLKANPDIQKLRIEGHTDETGPHETNVQLSKARAKAVRDYLIRRGIKANRLTSEGYGPDRPRVSGTDAESRAKNRRVEFIIE